MAHTQHSMRRPTFTIHDTWSITSEAEKSDLADSQSLSKRRIISQRRLIAFVISCGLLLAGLSCTIPSITNKTSPLYVSNLYKRQSTEHTFFERQFPSEASTTGGDGSVVTMENGQSFVYNNTFGGFWVSTPFNNSAQCRSSVKPLSEQWDFSTDLINGVSVGGWFVLEPFITPSIFEPYNGQVIDEWTLSEALGTGLTAFMTNHYETFVTEEDFAQIAAAGLNWVRISIPYWFIETYEGEPYLAQVGWPYFVRALDWARKYGLRVELDFHAHPGSQNGQNHSGKFGNVGWLNGVMGLANAQRSLSYIRTLTEFISQPEYSPVVPLFLMVNEPYQSTIGTPQMEAFYLQAYQVAREASGIGAGNGPMLAIHDGFLGADTFAGFMSGSDRMALEIHSYLAFSSFSSSSYQSLVTRPCQWWAGSYNTSMNQFGFTFSGEWTNAANDCGQYVNGVGIGAKYDGTYTAGQQGQVFGDCSDYTDWQSWTPAFQQQITEMSYSFMDSTRNWFFWTWKTGLNAEGINPNPLWSYKLGLDQGWIPSDPTLSVGKCAAQANQLGLPGSTYVDYEAPLASWKTGGLGANEIAASVTASYATFPPSELANNLAAASIPTMTPTGSVITLQAMEPSALAVASGAGDGWNNPSDIGTGYYTPIAGCSYLNAYSGVGAGVPGQWPCTGTGAAQQTAAPLRA